MNQMDCAGTREHLPELLRSIGTDRLVEAHLDVCGECRAEWGPVRTLHRTRPRPSPGFEGRLLRRLRLERATDTGRSWWGLTAAAVAALMIGIGLTTGPAVDVVSPAFAVELDEGWPLRSEEGLIAGAPVLDELSDDELSDLLVVLAQDVGDFGR